MGNGNNGSLDPIRTYIFTLQVLVSPKQVPPQLHRLHSLAACASTLWGVLSKFGGTNLSNPPAVKTHEVMTKIFQFPNLLMHLLNMKGTSVTESDTTILRNQFIA